MKSNSEIKQIEPSIILKELTFEGDIIGEGALEIEGRVLGDIRCLSASIGASGVVEGNITAERVEILGEVSGDIVAKKIICGASAKIRGNILHSVIHIENGADLEGNCRKFVPQEGSDEVVESIEATQPTEQEQLDLVPAEPAQQEPQEQAPQEFLLAEQDAYKSEDLVYKKEA